MVLVNAWSDERIEQLKKLFDANLSASQIAAEMGHLSRNAVVGKLHRLGIKRGRVIKAKSDAPRAARKAPVAKRPHVEVFRLVGNKVQSVLQFDDAILRQADVVPLNITLMNLGRSQCRYPTQTEPTLFCGTERGEGSSYCPQHAELCRGTPTRPVRPYVDHAKSQRALVGAWI